MTEEDLRIYIEPMDFHQCDTPRGMNYYNLKILTAVQQRQLNALKLQTMKEDEKYLAANPEIRAFVAIMTKLVMRLRPMEKLQDVITDYFSKSRIDIETDIRNYVMGREPHKYETVSTMNVWPAHSKSHVSVFEDDYIGIADAKNRGFQSYASMLKSKSSLRHRGLKSVSTVSFDFQPSVVLPSVSDSMKNLNINYDKMEDIPSRTMMQSISEVTGYVPPSKVSILLPDEEFVDSEDGEKDETIKRKYSGHVPTIEDYDAGYGHRHRRQTYLVTNSMEKALFNTGDIILPHHEEEGSTESEEKLEAVETTSEPEIDYSTDPEMQPLLASREFHPSLEKRKSSKSLSRSQTDGLKTYPSTGSIDLKPLSTEVTSKDHQSHRLHLDVAVKKSVKLLEHVQIVEDPVEIPPEPTVGETDQNTKE